MNCADFLQSLVQWAKAAAEFEDRSLALMLVSNDKEGPARYAEGQLRLKTLHVQNLESVAFAGDAQLYESNERWGYPPPPGSFGTTPYPFAPANDSVHVHIDVATGRITLTSATKGKAVINTPQCADALLFGFATTGHGALGVAGFQRLPATLQAVVAEEDVQHMPGGSGPGTGPIHPPPPPFRFLRPYYVLSFRQESFTTPP